MADEQVVVRLVVDANSSRQDLATFSADMTKAGDTTERSMKSMAKAIENLQARSDPIFKAQIIAQREVDKATAVAANAVKYFGVSQDEANKIVQRATDNYSAYITKAREAAAANRTLQEASKAAAASAAQQQFNSVLGVKSEFSAAGRGNDIAAYGKSLDELRAKYNPVFAAQKSYKESLLEITAAYKSGAIPTENEYRSAIQRTKDAFAQQVVATRQQADATTVLGRATSGVQAQLVALAAGAGPVGVFLSSFGPWGLAAAIGLGAISSSLGAVSSSANKFADDMLMLRDVSRSLDITSEQFQAINDSASKFAITEERVAAVLQRLTSELDNTRRGQGELYDLLRRIDPALAQEMAMSRDAASALGVLAKAYDAAGTSRQKLDRLVGGKQGGAIGLLFQDIGENGGLGAITEAFKKSGDSIDQDLIEKVARLRAEISDMSADAKRNFASIFSANILQGQREFAEKFLELSRVAKSFQISDELRYLLYGAATAAGFLIGGPVGAAAVGATAVTAEIERRKRLASGDKSDTFADRFSSAKDNPLKTVTKEQYDRSSAELEINNLKKRIEMLGGAATSVERLSLKEKELKLALRDNVVAQNDYNRALGSARLDAVIEQEGKRLSLLGQSADTAEIVAQKIREVTRANMQGARISDEQASNIARVAKEQANGTAAILEQAGAQKIASQTQGLSAAAAAALSTKLQLLARDERSGKVATEEDNAARQKAITLLQEQTQAANKASIGNQIKFDRATAALSQEDIQIAQQLRLLYGDDIPTALSSTEAAAMRVTNQIREMSDATSGFAQNLVSGLMQGRSLMESLGGAASGLIQKLASGTLDRFMKGGGLFGNQSLASGQGALGVVGAGVAGYQSGSPLGGALGGALAGASFGPVGAVVGGIAGLLGGILGGQNKAAEEAKARLDAAKEAWQQMALQVRVFGEFMRGDIAGGLTSEARETMQKYREAWHAALAAKDEAAMKNLANEYVGYIERITGDFRKSFGGVLQSLADGQGFDGPFLRASGNIKGIADRLKGFITDTTKAFTGGQEFLRGINYKSGEEGTVQESLTATQVAQKYLLSLLEGGKEMSAVQQNLNALRGTADQLKISLVDLGMSAEEAATSVSERLKKEMVRLKAEFESGINEKINSASGKGYLNDLARLSKEVETMLADAKSLGSDPTLIQDYFKKQSQSIIEGANLSGDAFKELLKLFPQLSGAVNQFGKSLDTVIQQLTDYQNGLLTDGNLSTLSPTEKLSTLKTQFSDAVKDANKSGDQESLTKLQAISTQYLNEAKSFYGSGTGYADIFSEVLRVIEAQKKNLLSIKGGNSDLTRLDYFKTGEEVRGFAQGGVVGNGVYNKDSVFAKYAGGGSIMLAGNEFVTRATSVNPATYGALNYINNTGKVPGNDNAGWSGELARVIAMAAASQIEAIREEIGGLREEVKRLTDTTRIEASRAQRPGRKAA